MNSPLQNIIYKFKTGNKLYWLIGINVVVFLISLLFPVVDLYLRLPAFLPALGTYFWTPITYMFVNDGFLGTLFNLLWLYWMGQVFMEYMGEKRLLWLYIMGGLAGAVLFILVCAVLPQITHSTPFLLLAISGASASVLTIIVATATLLPNTEVVLFIWPVKLKWLILIYAIFDLVNIRGGGTGLIVAHIGGALLGFAYIKSLQSGGDWIISISNIFKRGPKLSKLKVVARNNGRKTSSRSQQEEVDLILDKISKSGYESLNKEEKEVLFRASKNES